MAKEIRLLCICPSAVIRAGLEHIIVAGTELRVVSSMSDLSDLTFGRLSSLEVDAIILDPSAASAAGILNLRSYYEPLNGCIVIGALNAAYSNEILDQFNGYFTVNDNPASIIRRIREAVNTVDSYSCGKESDSDVLSTREKEVIAEVAKGLTNKEIADVLNISIFTVTTHRKNISQKLGIRSIAGLTLYAVMNHIIDEDSL